MYSLKTAADRQELVAVNVVTSTADELSEGTHIDDLELQKYCGVWWIFRDFRLRCIFQEWILSKSY